MPEGDRLITREAKALRLFEIDAVALADRHLSRYNEPLPDPLHALPVGIEAVIGEVCDREAAATADSMLRIGIEQPTYA